MPRNFFCRAAASAFSETEKTAMPGGSASAFCEPQTARSRPHSSASTRVAASDVTTSAKRRASLFSWTTFAMAARSEIVPTEVSLWTTVTIWYFFSASAFFTSSARIGLPHSAFRIVVSRPSLWLISPHLSEKAPLQQARTGPVAQETRPASQTPVAEVASVCACPFVRKTFGSFSRMRP